MTEPGRDHPRLDAFVRSLSSRQLGILKLIADGLTNEEIGERLGLSHETVKSHIRHLLPVLGARSRAHAVAIGYREGLLD